MSLDTSKSHPPMDLPARISLSNLLRTVRLYECEICDLLGRLYELMINMEVGV